MDIWGLVRWVIVVLIVLLLLAGFVALVVSAQGFFSSTDVRQSVANVAKGQQGAVGDPQPSAVAAARAVTSWSSPVTGSPLTSPLWDGLVLLAKTMPLLFMGYVVLRLVARILK